MRKSFLLLVALPIACVATPWGKVAVRGLPLCFQDAPVRLPMLVPGLHPSQVASTFGAPRSGGRRHEGVDLFAPRNTPVLSPTKGVVISVGENSLGGRTVTVLGPGPRWHYFAHLEAYGKVKVGQRVPEGYALGTVGDSGNARRTPPHLHYGIYRFPGKALDPLPLLKASPRSSFRK
ncbi:M23 family metallopeptidase [Mesoterricola silvestris]|uniref:Peptidase M23 n=1 Tax=Mesoterricola silvestris TaxID=2927979 RepID=A0AA48GPG6_9BACT|nr:peptidase M23 [Mesoterricola silvestris]